MTDTAPETQTCPFCYTEMDVRADVCPNCLATKDTTPEWAKRLKVYWSAAVVIFIGLALAFIDGKGMNWWGVPFVGVGVFFLLKARKVDVSDVIWHRKEQDNPLMETHWIDSPKHQADRKELADLCGRPRTPAEDARLAELKAQVRDWAHLNQAAEEFVNGAP